MPRPEASIRDSKETGELWREFRAVAMSQGKTAREALIEAIKLWLEKQKEGK